MRFADNAPVFWLMPYHCPYFQSGLHLGDVDMEESDGVVLKFLALRLVSLDIRQARNAVSLQAPMQSLSCQVRDGRLQGIETIIQRQQRPR